MRYEESNKKEATMNNNTLNNIESPFTEIFALLIKDWQLPNHSSLNNDPHDTKILRQHVDNAINVLVQGLQDVGYLLSVTMQCNNQSTDQFNNVGFFVSTVVNLIEALIQLGQDIDYLNNDKQQGEITND